MGRSRLMHYLKLSLVAFTASTLALASSSALATANSFASMTEFSYQLYDLNISDGVDAAIVFSGREYSAVAFANSAQLSDVGNGNVAASIASSESAAAASVANTRNFGPNLFGDFSASSASSALGSSYSYATLMGAFTLSANTRVVFAATSSFANSAMVTFEGAHTSAGLYAYSDSQYADDEFANDLTSVNSASGSRLMSVSFVNSNGSSASGNLYASVAADVYSPVSTVPEPESLSLLLGGLGVIGGVIARQRRLRNFVA